MALSYTITQLPAIVTRATADVLPIVDVDDFSEAPTGTTKKITVAQLYASVTLTGTTTTAALSSTTGAFSSNVTVGGALGVTGGMTGSTLGLTGALSAARGSFAGASGGVSDILGAGITGVTNGLQIQTDASNNIALSFVDKTGSRAFGVLSNGNTVVDHNLGVTGTASFGGAIIPTGGVTGALTPTVTATYDLGTTGSRWSSLFLSAGISAAGSITGLNLNATNGTVSGSVQIGTSVLQVGSSTNHDVQFLSNNSPRWQIEKIGNWLTVADNAYDLGASGANRPRTGYFGTSVIAPTFTGNLTGTVTGILNVVTAAGATGQVYKNNTDGLVLYGVAGSSGDVTLANKNGANALTVPTGTTNVSIVGTCTAAGFSGPLTGNVTGNVSGTSGSTTGNAATATALATSRNINGVAFNGTADITVTAAAGTLTGTTLNSAVVTSSLTTVGTLGTLVVSGGITSGAVTTSQIYGNGSAPTPSQVSGSATITGLAATSNSTATAGEISWTVTGAGSLTIRVTFPSAYSHTPAVVISPRFAGLAALASLIPTVTLITTTYFEMTTITNYSTLTSYLFDYVVIG